MRYLLILLCLMAGLSVQAQKLAEFNLNSYDGWNYTRSGVTLSRDYISGYKVNIYGNYMLVSPLFNAQNVKYVKAQVRIVSKNYFLDKYSYSKASPTLQLINASGEVVSSLAYSYKEALYQQDVEAYLPVPEGSQMLSWRISVPSGDVNSTGAVMEVALTASDTNGKLIGDVNADGMCDVSDVTSTINMILESEVINTVADLNADGNVDVSDVTALINNILN